MDYMQDNNENPEVDLLNVLKKVETWLNHKIEMKFHLKKHFNDLGYNKIKIKQNDG